MTKSKFEKSPYKDHTIKEVMEAEFGSYYIQIGDNMFESETGKMAFQKERAEQFFDMVYAGLVHMYENGTQEEKEDAVYCLSNLRMIPLRFH